jgi:hypothetical protein
MQLISLKITVIKLSVRCRCATPLFVVPVHRDAIHKGVALQICHIFPKVKDIGL